MNNRKAKKMQKDHTFTLKYIKKLLFQLFVSIIVSYIAILLAVMYIM